MSPVASTLGADCDVRFTWYAPTTDGGQPITSYKIEVQDKMGSFQRLNSCSSTPMRGAMSCTVSMSTLSAAPFNLGSGDAILVTGRAQNGSGYSDRSTASGGVRMMTTGLDAPHLRLEGVPATYINLAWTEIPNANQYEVEWDGGESWSSNIVWRPYKASLDGASSDTTRLPNMRVRHTFAAHGGAANSENYRFRVRALGGCGGANPYSNILHVCLSEEPPIMPTVTTETVGCAVRINIPQAISSSSPADKIRIQIQGSDYQYYSESLPCSTDGSSRECVVHQDILKSHPYNLRSGHLVIVRVAGYSTSGNVWGAYSGPNNVGAPIASVPYKLGAPTVVEKTSTTLTLTWPRYYGSSLEQAFDHDYELQMCAVGECKENSAEWKTEAYLSNTSYTHTGLVADKLYKYRVRATCVCEEAEFSEELCVELSAAPLAPSATCPTHIAN
jgi:hypothetical protein